MIIPKGFPLSAPIDKLFDFPLKPETIVSCLPETESVKLLDETRYECVVIQKVGPISVKLKFVNKLIRGEKPTRIKIEGDGEGMRKPSVGGQGDVLLERISCARLLARRRALPSKQTE